MIAREGVEPVASRVVPWFVGKLRVNGDLAFVPWLSSFVARSGCPDVYATPPVPGPPAPVPP